MTVHAPLPKTASIHGGLLDHARTVEILQASIRIGSDGQLTGFDEAAARIIGLQPPHVQILSEVAAERERQIAVEGWSRAHDDEHDRHELFAAAFAYINPKNQSRKHPPKGWPWERRWWKPKGFQRNFVRGMALWVAAVEGDMRRFAKARQASKG